MLEKWTRPNVTQNGTKMWYCSQIEDVKVNPRQQYWPVALTARSVLSVTVKQPLRLRHSRLWQQRPTFSNASSDRKKHLYTQNVAHTHLAQSNKCRNVLTFSSSFLLF